MYKIYMHKNKLNEKVYIGFSKDVERRWRNNGIEYKPYKSDNSRFWDAIVKDGWEVFEQSILAEVDTQEKAYVLEEHYIKLYKSNEREFGYNISSGGNGGRIYEEHPKGMLGKKQTEYQKESHRLWASNPENNCMNNGQVIWGETHEHPKGMLGKSHSEETINRLKEFKGSKHHQSKAIIAEFNDDVIEFGHVSEVKEYYGISPATIYKVIKSAEPYTTKYKNKKHLEGLKLKYK